MRSALPSPTTRRRLPRALAPIAAAALAVPLLAAIPTAPTYAATAGVSTGASTGTTTGVTTGTSTGTSTAARRDPNPVTPGDFTGYGFDQCLTPTQDKMDAWLRSSPYLAVGIYISGDSRACRNQPNLTPEWVSTQLARGWKLLPITLGPQASCQPRFPRYDDDFTISPKPGSSGTYYRARKMGQNSAVETVEDAQALGLTKGSTLWYDLEGFDLGNNRCRESALWFLHAWVSKVEQLGYASGVYSSAGSGIRALDDARVNRPGTFRLPQHIWIARWDGQANTSTSYIRADGWLPGGRMKQYRGGHDERWGGVTINIDSNYLDLGRGSVAPAERHCGGVRISFNDYVPLFRPTNGKRASKRHVKALQCYLTERKLYDGPINGMYHQGMLPVVQAWRTSRGISTTSSTWYRRDWMTITAYGAKPLLKVGHASKHVRRLQRSLNAAHLGSTLSVTGTFDNRTTALVKTYQGTVGLTQTGIVDRDTWKKLMRGHRG